MQEQATQAELTRELVEAKFPNLKNLEATHGPLKAIRVDDKIGLFKKPSRQVISMASSLEGSDPMGFMAMIAENCFIEGDKELLTDDDLFLAIVPLLNQLRELKVAELVKL
jgi:hypothetical protein